MKITLQKLRCNIVRGGVCIRDFVVIDVTLALVLPPPNQCKEMDSLMQKVMTQEIYQKEIISIEQTL